MMGLCSWPGSARSLGALAAHGLCCVHINGNSAQRRPPKPPRSVQAHMQIEEWCTALVVGVADYYVAERLPWLIPLMPCKASHSFTFVRLTFSFIYLFIHPFIQCRRAHLLNCLVFRPRDS